MARPLSVFHVDTERGWRGGEQQMADLMDGLRRRGHRVTAAVQPDGEVFRRLTGRGYDVRGVSMHGDADLFAVRALRRHVRDIRPDVVHSHTSHAHALAAMAARLAGRPVVVASRRVIFSIHRHSWFGLARLKYRHGVDRILCVSDAVREALIADGVDAERLRVVRSSLDPARVRDAAPIDVRAQFALPRDSLVVLAAGALDDSKGHRFLVEAMPAVLRGAPRTRVVIAGEGPLRRPIEAQAKSLGVEAALVLAGHVDNLPGWYASTDVLAAPSLAEGLGTSVLEAMAAGVPVVASRVGGHPEMVRDGLEGLLVPPSDPPALGTALLRVLGDAGERARMGAAGRKRIDEIFRTDRMVDETLEVYEEALAERAGVGRGR